ncbi:hypothetical protein WG66_014464 [Moniliophthora roreri]|nr:hypothetical protein WG66_014464 [Moniliophthora roreri]
MPLLPFPTNDLICKCLSPRDLYRYSRANREAYGYVQSYRARAFDIYALLSRYFTEPEINHLDWHAHLRLNRSPILQSPPLPRIGFRYTGVVGEFLLAIGYIFEPAEKQRNELSAAIQEVTGNMADGMLYDYSGRGFAGVYNLSRNGQKIQLITASISPMDIILNFHSTVVMNVISYSHGYCLYPKATFEEKRSLICFSSEKPERDVARQKYVDRGWKMLNPDGSEWRSDCHYHSYQPSHNGSLLASARLESFRVDRLRHVGDSYCWTIALPPIPNYSSSTIVPAPSTDNSWIQSHGYSVPTPLILEEMESEYRVVESNSWSLVLREAYEYSSWFRSRMIFETIENSKLRFSYCVAHDSSNYGLEPSLLRKVAMSPVYVKMSLHEELEFMAEKGAQRMDFEKPTLDMIHRMTIKDHFQKIREEEEAEEADIRDIHEFDSEAEYDSWEEVEDSD